MKKQVIFLTVLFFIVCRPSSAGTMSGEHEQEIPSSFSNPSWSPDGNILLLTGPGRRGVYLYDTSEGSLTLITDGNSSGYWYNWSPDGTRFGFKSFVNNGGDKMLQVPSVYDIRSGTVIPLADPGWRAGVPSFSRDGRISFTSGTTLMVLDSSLRVESKFELGTDVNLAPISPDGTKVVFNDNSDNLWLLNLATSDKVRMTPGEQGYFGPVWSPDGTKIACSTLGGDLAVIDMNTMSMTKIGRGSRHSWSPDGTAVLYGRYYGEPGLEVTGSDIFMTSADGRVTENITGEQTEFLQEPSLSPRGDLAFCSPETGKLFRMRFPSGKTEELFVKEPCVITAPGQAENDLPGAELQPADTDFTGVPYMHQVYDTPNWFNGNWACNATSAMMCIEYYNILPYWDCTVSVPYPHVSHYGNYVSGIYSYNGHTYDTASPDAGGTTAWGGYGYIVQNNWEETRGHMQEYFTYHGLDNVAVDWSPVWEEFQAQVASLYPTVFLSLITTSGHYTVGIGYVTGWHTAIFNDPYGDKNTDPYKDYYGAHVYYDWPGYNNGYENLNTMSCFIYARHAPSQPVIDSVTDIDVCARSGIQVNFTAGSAADRHDLYRDGSLAAQGYASGTNYDPGDAASHSYFVRAVNTVAGRYTNSASVSGTDADMTCTAPTQSVMETVNTDKSGFCWGPVDADSVRALRGIYADLPALCTTAVDFSCYATGLTGCLDISTDEPSGVEGRCFYYLLQGYNGCCGDVCFGPLGSTTPPCITQVQTPTACP